MKDTKILIAAHKKSEFPQDNIFLPIQVGRKLSKNKLDIQGDDIGDNISEKNPSYCELTGMYWAWKNLEDVKHIGLCHYRRYFDFFTPSFLSISFRKTNEVSSITFPKSKINDLLREYDIIVAKPKIFGTNLKEDYCKFHYLDDFQTLENIISEKYPEYMSAFLKVMEQNNKLYHANMFIADWSLYNKYCNWLFSILEEAEKRIAIKNYSDYQKRIFGYMGERLLNVYMAHNNLKIKPVPVVFVTNDKHHTPMYHFFRNIIFSLIYFFRKEKK